MRQTLLALLALPPLSLGAQGPARIAVDTVASRQLVAYWVAHPHADELACLYGRRIRLPGGAQAFDVDSARFRAACAGPGIIGILGFARPAETESDLVLDAMAHLLDRRPDLDVVGLVVGTEPMRDGSGHIVQTPRVWAAWRKRPETPEMPGCWDLLIPPAQVARVLDGDTFDLYALGLTPLERVRLLGVDTAELGDSLGPAARDSTRAWLARGPFVLAGCRRDHFGRLLAAVTRGADTLAQDLIRWGLGRPMPARRRRKPRLRDRASGRRSSPRPDLPATMDRRGSPQGRLLLRPRGAR